MGMYQPLLFIHSWMRWTIIFAIIYFLIRSINGWSKQSPWTSQDNYYIWAFNQVFGYQILFGLTLWISLSPMTKAGFKDSSLILENSMIFFWFLRHPITMILALGAFHMGKAKGRSAVPEKRFKIFAVTFLIVLLVIASAIPWPGLSYGRSLFRWFL